MQSLEGTIERITYYNDETLFMVARVRTDDERLVTVIGNMPRFNVGERLSLQGEWVQHKDFGLQFKAARYELDAPHTEKGIRNFLASGLIRGVGPATAEKIVAHFGLDALQVITATPERLCEVDGIGEKKAKMIAESLKERQEVMKVMAFLQSYGVGIGYAARIYRRYGEETIAKVSENPYRLAEEVFGVGFKTADKIALAMGLAANSPHRIRAAIVFYLNEAQEQGHVYLPKPELIKRICEALSTADAQVTEEQVLQQLNRLVQGRQLILEEAEGEEAVFTAPLYHAECYVAKRLLSLAESRLAVGPVNFAGLEAGGISLAEEQRQAVRQAAEAGLLVITGGPGTGKTTTIRALLALFQQNGLEVLLAAPTGRAAKRMTEATGMEAKTIHRLLEYAPVQGEASGFAFQRTEERPLEAHAVIIDEMSMVDLPLFYHLLRAIPAGCKLILVGDMDQLPSVGPGNVLRDIIASGAVPAVRLQHIFRQSAHSMIVSNAHAVNCGRMPRLRGSEDFFFLQEDEPEKVLQLILDLCCRRLPQFKNKDPIDDIQVLTPMRRTVLGVDNLNHHLQKTLNPGAPQKTELRHGAVTFRLGDKVMQIRNNYQKEVFNGDVGRITYINSDDGEMFVAFPDVGGPREVIYDQTELDELVLAYATSVHKSQGSEYPVVVMPVVTQHFIMLQRNLLYTAITRAKELVVLIGTKKALAIAVHNNKVETRYTRLAARLANCR
ncbi:MAG: ATP-dependent RecD-like DNA helicase [Firmicutes bacterium]|jgi:exodeoxyribonuclease V alpha subunit|nr:ATP-dependent RecD-like DNA helicase [Bacillota bacterium]